MVPKDRLAPPADVLLLCLPRHAHALVGGDADPDGRVAAVILMVGGPRIQCSGTKVGPRYFLTASHCVDPVNFFSYAALMQSGAPSLCPGDSGGPVIRDGRVAGLHGTVYGVGLADGAHTNISVNLHGLRHWEALREAAHHRP